ncbi:hypothetical protein KAI58_00725 [Candidatus Gracilibacteria bacterium]|nr:hypothetical protein [Candidatus Gracilibacteria bacterium]
MAADNSTQLKEEKEQFSEKEKVPRFGNVTKQMVESSVSILGSKTELGVFSEELKQGNEIFADDKKLEKALEGAIDAEKKLSLVFGNRLGKTTTFPEISGKLEEVAHDYGGFDEKGNFKTNKFSLKDTLSESWQETEGRFFLLRPFLLLKNVIKKTFVWRAVKKYERKIDGYFKVKKSADKFIDKVDDLKDKGTKAKEYFSTYRHSVVENPAAQAVIGKYKGQVGELLGFFKKGKLSPQEFTNQFKDLTGKISREGGKELSQIVNAKKLPGFSLNSAGKYMVVEVLSKSVLNAVEQKRFGAFSETLTDVDVLKEAIPIVGSWKSLGRLFDEDDETPFKLKLFDAGLNIVGDAALIAGVISSVASFGTTAAIGVAARTTITGIGKLQLKKEARKQIVKRALKTSASSASKIVLSAGKFSLISILVQQAFNRFVPGGKIMEMTTKTATKNFLTPTQARAVEMVMAR